MQHCDILKSDTFYISKCFYPWSFDLQNIKNYLVTPSCNNTREDSTHGHPQMINTKLRLIIFSAAEDGEALQSQQQQDQELTVAQI